MSTDAWQLLDGKTSVPSELRTAEWNRVPQWIKERSFYMAGVSRAEVLEEFRSAAAAIVDGKSSDEEQLKRLQQYLEAKQYQPEAGQAGTIKDLSTSKRILTTLRINKELLQGWAQRQASLQPDALRAYPGWELVRFMPRVNPRIWPARWELAGGTLTDGRMIALVTDEIWLKLGTMFADSIGTDYPPFAWGSGMGVMEIDYSEMVDLGFEAQIRAMMQRMKRAPITSPNATMETTPKITTPELRKVLSDHLEGLAEWEGDKLVFTDPNGSRPYPQNKLAEVITAKLPPGILNLQKDAAKQWFQDSSKINLKRGRDVTDDFARLVQRVEPLKPETPVWRGERFASSSDLGARLNDIAAADGAAVMEVGQSWTLLQSVAQKFSSLYDLPYRLVLFSKNHRTLKPVSAIAKAVFPKYWTQAEAISIEGSRWRMVGEPITETLPTGLRVVYAEVEEI